MSEQDERAVLSALLSDPGAVAEVIDYLDAEDFRSEENQLIYSAILHSFSIGERPDEVVVRGHLASHRNLTRAGGESYLFDLRNTLADIVNVRQYSEAVKTASIGRKLRLIGKALDKHENNSREILAWSIDRLMDISSKSVPGEVYDLGGVARRIVEETISVYNGTTVKDGIRTGFPHLDSLLLYLKAGDVYIISARPSVGKSAFVTQVGLQVAKQGCGVLFISMEMTHEQLGRRILSVESLVPYSRLDDGKAMTKMQVEQLKQAEERIRTLPMWIDDKSGRRVSDVRARARRQQAKDKLHLIIVDYLQLLAKDPESREELSSVSKDLKALAKDLRVPVIAVSSMSRYIDRRDSGRAVLSDLRGSGQIEFDADLVAFLSHPPTNRRKMTLSIEKHRNGPTGEVLVEFDPKTTRFEELPQEV